MKVNEQFRELARVAFHAASNWISLTGVVFTTAAGVTLVWIWLLETLSPHPVNPYTGILFFLLLPGLFVGGLALIPLGIYLRRRKLRRLGTLPVAYPKVDLGSTVIRKLIVVVVAATAINIAFLGTASVKGVEYMDSNKFCGQVCHTPMAPEYAAFLNSPHSRVGCAQCHIGPGAGWFVKSKLSGTRQLFAVTFGTFSRPIPSPVEALRPARETCEQCHWPQKFHGDKLLVVTKYAEDEANTPSTTVLLLKIGGGKVGIHGRHLDEAERISYQAADKGRQEIPRVLYKDDQGKPVEYVAGDSKLNAAQIAALPTRKMDCVDCHNRPTHAFDLPEKAVDRAIADGHISRDLPFIRKMAVEFLRREYPSQEVAATQITQALQAYYRTSYAELFKKQPGLVEAAAKATREIYLRNVFPGMKLTWGTHVNHIGHQDGVGCWRCHDGSHTSPDGRTITGDCSACHQILAQDEKDPKILKDLGIR
jgi:hypothetical protein